MAPQTERVAENIKFGEGPHWDEETQTLYFVDMRDASINKYVPATGRHARATLGSDHVSIVIPIRGEKDKFLVSIQRKLAIVTWDGESEEPSEITTVFELDDPESSRTKFNDGKCDPSGRLWIGTMGLLIKKGDTTENPDIGSLYSFQDNKLTTHFTKIRVSNGLAFNAELKKFYHIDTFGDTIDEFDVNIENGTLANRKPIFTLKLHDDIPSNGIPDGMTIDTDGNLWVAVARASRIIKIDPRKPESLLDSIILPTKLQDYDAMGHDTHKTSIGVGGLSINDMSQSSVGITVNENIEGVCGGLDAAHRKTFPDLVLKSLSKNIS